MWHAFRIAFADPGDRNVAHGPDWLRFVCGEPHPFGNFVVANNPSVETLRTAVEPLARTGLPSAAILPVAPSAEHEELLKELGYTSAGPMPAMGVDIAKLGRTVAPAGYRLLEIDQDRGAEWAECLAAGYGLPLKVAEALSPVHVKPGPDVRFFAAERDGQMDAVSLVAIHEGIAGVYSVGTREKARGQGLGGLVTAEPLRRVADEGISKAVLQSSKLGYSVYRRLGFEDEGGVAFYLSAGT